VNTRRFILKAAPAVERHAGRIPDPVKRLRYLRCEMALLQRRAGAARPARYLNWVVIVAAFAVVPGPIPTGTAETFARERELVIPIPDSSSVVPPAAPRVWRVETSNSFELYSNGLRVDLTFAVHDRPRAPYPIFPQGGVVAAKYGTAPVGIVYHTTESQLPPFQEDKTRVLKRLGRNLLEMIRREGSYHYLIDRFGRVFRIVDESDAANHAGSSVWADAGGIYVNLNDSFLGVAVEGQTGAVGEVTPAQISAAKVLTEMLRSRYHIAAEDCITHAQVSVNPLNMRIGAHVDWAGKFPFAEVGLPDNYAIPLPSLYAFGFDHDATFLEVTGGRWKGLDLAEERVERQAAAQGLSGVRFKAILRRRYKDIAAALKQQAAQDAAATSVLDTTAAQPPARGKSEE